MEKTVNNENITLLIALLLLNFSLYSQKKEVKPDTIYQWKEKALKLLPCPIMEV